MINYLLNNFLTAWDYNFLIIKFMNYAKRKRYSITES